MSRLTARLDEAIDTAITAERLVGCVVLVRREGVDVYSRAAGLRDREAGLPMERDTIFRLASVSKLFTATAAMRLVQEHVVELDEPIDMWLRRFRPALTDGTVPTITLAHLLTHTSGLGYRFGQPDDHPYHALGVSDGLDARVRDLDENLARLAQAPLHFAPGAAWRYSLGLDVTGALLAAASGVTFPEVMRHAVLGPLELRDTGFAVRDPERLAVPYADGDERPVRMTDPHELVEGDEGVVTYSPGRALDPEAYPSGGAGMAGTADEVLRLLEALRTGGGPVLRAENAAAMLEDRVGPGAEADGPGWGFGFAGAVLDDPEAARVPHAPRTVEWGGAYGHHWFIDRDAGLTAVILTNTTLEGMSGPSRKAIVQAIYG
ncbi:serine hydrolase [Demequina sp. NBRC 110052]|uniref:serine hydrolase domain-containing protein n=1 Tax=Demequina sp. NBRC 110052 TaxID=1570341 RepID=UPI00190EBBF1|nr:serine hydrolase domain-containing protein [Demequina sp. NBRC 110052]